MSSSRYDVHVSTICTPQAPHSRAVRADKWYTGEAPFIFGQGMTYTKFTVTAVEAPCGTTPSAHSTLRCYTVTVMNSGQFAAAEVVMLFARPVALTDSQAPMPLPKRQLFDFGRTPTLLPGASFQLDFRECSLCSLRSTRTSCSC